MGHAANTPKLLQARFAAYLTRKRISFKDYAGFDSRIVLNSVSLAPIPNFPEKGPFLTQLLFQSTTSLFATIRTHRPRLIHQPGQRFAALNAI
jgi:hypothetical protein